MPAGSLIIIVARAPVSPPSVFSNSSHSNTVSFPLALAVSDGSIFLPTFIFFVYDSRISVNIAWGRSHNAKTFEKGVRFTYCHLKLYFHTVPTCIYEALKEYRDLRSIRLLRYCIPFFALSCNVAHQLKR